jgi:hypothetical protein
MKGIFSSNSPEDLLRMLDEQYHDLKKEPLNERYAFNFFVIAESLLDWKYPGYSNKKDRQDAQKKEPVLQVISHIASGAKHFTVEAKHHNSVSSTSVTPGYFPPGYMPSTPKNYFPESELIVSLENDAEAAFGKVISACDLAQIAIDYWHKNLK